ncbi:MAG: hypothetical protein HXS43_01945 [Theionarchaea archaeon]|nr:hypothetical protein [Theionarchaea archaeon]
MTMDRIAHKIAVDSVSMHEFFELMEKEQWKEEDLDKFVSTPGIQFLIRQEKDTSWNNSENKVKEFLKMAREGEQGKLGGWAAACREKVRTTRRLVQLSQRWEYLVEEPSRIVLSYLPEETEPKGRFYLLPGGMKESYADCTGLGINLGYDSSMKVDSEVQFHIGRQEYRYLLCETSGRDFIIDGCKTPEDYLREFLRITMREGMAMHMGLKAKGDRSEFLERHVVADESWKRSVEKAFQILMDSRTRGQGQNEGQDFEDEMRKLKETAKYLEEEVFSGEYSPAAMVGLSIARAIDPGQKNTFNEARAAYFGADSHAADLFDSSNTGYERGQYEEERGTRKRSLQQAVIDISRELGYAVFFELGRISPADSLVPPAVWEAFSVVKKEEGLMPGAGFP